MLAPHACHVAVGRRSPFLSCDLNLTNALPCFVSCSMDSNHLDASYVEQFGGFLDVAMGLGVDGGVPDASEYCV